MLFYWEKFDYLINLDGDDMFYPNFKIEYFQKNYKLYETQ